MADNFLSAYFLFLKTIAAAAAEIAGISAITIPVGLFLSSSGLFVSPITTVVVSAGVSSSTALTASSERLTR